MIFYEMDSKIMIINTLSFEAKVNTLCLTRDCHTPPHSREGRSERKKIKREKRERRVRGWKIRGERVREVSTPQALKLLDLLLLSRLLSYPLISQLQNQQGGSQFKHLIQGPPLA